MNVVSSHPQGTVLVVWVVPGAARSEVVGRHGDAVKVRVAPPAEASKANRAATEMLGGALGGAPVTLLAGATSRRKQFLITGLTPEQVTARLQLPGPTA